MATDYWPDQDGRISDGFTIGYCYADSTDITAGGYVKVGSPASGRVAVTVAAAVGDAIGVILKAPVVEGEHIPVLFYGVMKLTQSSVGDTTTVGEFVMNSANSGFVHMAVPLWSGLVLGGGASYILGMALQTTTANGDEILVLVGKCI